MRIFLIRHPKPDVAQGLCYGQSDLELAEEPARFAKQLLDELPNNIPLFSSPLLRCRLLAEALHNEPVYDDRLKEIHFGEWEMQAWSDIPRQQLDNWAANPLHYVPAGGESVAQMQERVLHFIDEKRKQGTTDLVLVTHAGVMKTLCGIQRKLPLEQWMSLHFDYGSLHQIELNP